jgi:heme-degrading monooxygenase HmoA
MIVRLWRGRVAASRAAEYRVYQEEVGPPNYRTVPGIRRIYMLGRDLGEHYEIAMLTFWESLQAIRAFAGDPVDKARYYDRDFDFLIDPPDKVEHFEVVESAALSPGTDERERVVRLWRGLTPAARKREAIRYGVEIDIPWYRDVAGNSGVCLLGRDLGADYEVAMLTFWESREAIRAFAGDPIDRANYDEYRRRGLDYLIDLPEGVEHFDVLVREEPSK